MSNTFNDGLSEQERHDVGLCASAKFCRLCAQDEHEKSVTMEMIRLRTKNKKLFNTLLEVKAMLPPEVQAKVEDTLKGAE